MIAPNDFRPILLVRGFDPLAESQETAYYGFNDGTVYPQKMGDDYIYEGMLLKFLKTRFLRAGDTNVTSYLDATNALRYTPHLQGGAPAAPPDERAVAALKEKILGGRTPGPRERAWLARPVVLDPAVAARFNVPNTLWVYRYYDFKFRDVRFYAEQLRKVIEIVETVTGVEGVNLICHSMGGVIARYLIQTVYASKAEAETHINKWVTLGAPHRGIAFSPTEYLTLGELEYFNRTKLETDLGAPLGEIAPHYDPQRALCIVGTNHAAYQVGVAAALNQAVSWLQGQDQNHSDGLVKQENATLIGAYRADVFKCHGGKDSLITSREAFELATRFFFGDVRVLIRLREAEIKKRYEGYQALSSFFDGTPEFYVGFSVKPRNLDFFLHRQDKDSENCFGPLRRHELTAADFIFDHEDPARNGVIYEGFFNSALSGKNNDGDDNLVFRFDTYVGERDAFVFHHSDTEIVNAQSYFEIKPLAAVNNAAPDPLLELFFYPRIKSRDRAIACVYQGDDRYELKADFGDIDPDFRLILDITIEGPWRAPQDADVSATSDNNPTPEG